MRSCLVAIVSASVISAILCGCATRSYSPLGDTTTPTVLTVETNHPEVIVVAPQPAPEIVVLAHEPTPVIGLDNVDAGPLPVVTNTVPMAAPRAISFGRGWIPLSSWSARCAIGKAERIVRGDMTAYRIPTRTGVCVLTIGSRLAHWNGVAVWLGFAPSIVRGEPHIHALDAEKTLLPLTENQSALPTSAKTVVIDPGHGGSDSGTRGARNQFEKNYALDWALRTERLLTNAGWKIFLTRRSDVDMSLAERAAFADRVRADLFLSLHFNSTFPQTQPSGIETYCLTPAGIPSTLLRGYSDDERRTYPNNAFDAANMVWAFRIHQSLVKETGAHDDGVKRARFMGVLRYQSRPAILIEGGFLSNARDAANIDSSAYRDKLANAVAGALK